MNRIPRLMKISSISFLAWAMVGCSTYHTTYTHLYAEGHDPGATPHTMVEKAGALDGWQNFWVFGLIPGTKTVDTTAQCGAGRVETIRTYQSGLQFLISNLQGAFALVNVWTPYTAQSDCIVRTS